MHTINILWNDFATICAIDYICAKLNVFVQSKSENWGITYEFSDKDWEKVKVVFE